MDGEMVRLVAGKQAGEEFEKIAAESSTFWFTTRLFKPV
jgi:hypothetical protein